MSDTRHGAVVVVRTQSAGVHVGHLDYMHGQHVRLLDARRVWRWRGAYTLHELSQKGSEDKGEYTRISDPVPAIELLTATEVIECSGEGGENLCRSRWVK